jgi:hypothetical protein
MTYKKKEAYQHCWWFFMDITDNFNTQLTIFHQNIRGLSDKSELMCSLLATSLLLIWFDWALYNQTKFINYFIR